MTNSWIDIISRYFWDITFRAIKYRYLLMGIIFSVIALFLFEYWLVISQPPVQVPNVYSGNLVAITMWTPDRLFIGEENQQSVEFDVNYSNPGNTPIRIMIDSFDDNVSFTKKVIVLEPGNQEKEARSTIVYYRKVSSPKKTFKVRATFTINNNTKDLVSQVSVFTYSKNIFVILSSAIAILLTLVSLVVQVKSLLKG